MRKEKRMVKKDVLMRITVLAITLINLILTAAGKNPLGIASDEVYVAVSGIAASLSAVWAAWKNNSMTTAASVGDRLMSAIKVGRITADEAEKLLIAIEGKEEQK